MEELQVLYEDNHLLVVDKQAGIATQGEVEGVPTIARMAASYLKTKYNKPGNVYVGVVSRIDRLVSGVLVLARTSKAASRLSNQFRTRQPDKKYLAYIEGRLETGSRGSEWMEVEHWVRKNESEQRMEVTGPPGPAKKGARRSAAEPKQARLRVKALTGDARSTLVAVELQTGRKHQIRLQLAELGHPVVGDRKYGSQRKWPAGIALHCYRLQISHPTRSIQLTLGAAPAKSWKSLPSAMRDVVAQTCSTEVQMEDEVE